MRRKLALISVLSLGFLLAPASGNEVDKGVDLYHRSEYAEAHSVLEKVTNSEPDNARAHLFMGLALIGEDQVDAAERHLKRADELQASDDTKAGLALHAIAKRDLQRAESLLGGAQGDLSDYARGVLYVHQKKNEEAVPILEQYLEKYPSSAYAHYYAGLAYSSMRKNDRMLRHFEHFLALRPNAPEARKVRSVVRTIR
jgi:tetratricopeptide (TPR) repeat protein